MNQKSIITALALSILTLCSWANAASSTAKPNIIWIMADDLGYGDLGCYGSPDIPTPHIDSLAAAGVKCEAFYAASSVCSPSRACILSGRYPQTLGIGGALMGQGGLSANVVTIAEALKTHGYTTGLIGKWHLGYEGDSLPNRQGFDEFYGHRGGKVDFFTHFDTAQKVKDSNFGTHDFYENDREIFPKGYTTDLFTNRAIEFVGKHKDQPFFLFLAYNAPHYARPGVLQAPDAYIKKFAKDEKPTNRQIYTAMVNCMDDGIGRLIDALKSNGLDDNTLIIFVSDNGGDPSNGGSNKPFSGAKWTNREGGIRVPMIARWPGKLPAGTTTKETLHMIDFFPTMMAAAGAKIPENPKLPGFNFLDVLKGKANTPERPLFFGNDTVIKGKWKVLKANLYDLQADPGEKRDLAAEQPKVIEELKSLRRPE